MKKSHISIIAIILASFAAGVWFYPQMPELMASHWNFTGQVDGYMSKFWGLFLMPIISSAMFLLFLVIPEIDPHKENIKKFRKYFDGFIVLMVLFLFYIYGLTILWNLGVSVNMNIMLPPVISILLFYCGVLIGKAKMNWFIGIRTPWTLSSEAVWDKTHSLGAKLFKICSVISLTGVFLSSLAIFLTVIPVTFASILLVVYSYLEHRKETISLKQ